MSGNVKHKHTHTLITDISSFQNEIVDEQTNLFDELVSILKAKLWKVVIKSQKVIKF